MRVNNYTRISPNRFIDSQLNFDSMEVFQGVKRILSNYSGWNSYGIESFYTCI